MKDTNTRVSNMSNIHPLVQERQTGLLERRSPAWFLCLHASHSGAITKSSRKPDDEPHHNQLLKQRLIETLQDLVGHLCVWCYSNVW